MKGKCLLSFALIFLFILGGVGTGLFISYLHHLPHLEFLEEYFPPVSTVVYSSDNKLICQFYQQKRLFVSLDQIPKTLIDTFLAVEDSKFYSHHGLDYKAIIRAFWVNFKAGKIKEGGSTITQQLSKVLFLTPKRNFARKIKEAILALQIEKKYTKDEILELYLNQIYFGNGAYGVESAARTIFGKTIQELDLAQTAMIAGLPNSPNRYSPQNNFSLALRRRNHVLKRMVGEQVISEEQFFSAVTSPMEILPKKGGVIAPYFSEYIRQYLEKKYGANLLYKGGLKVYTTLDSKMQEAAEEAVYTGLKIIDERRQKRAYPDDDQSPQAALIAIDPQNGFVKCMVGGRDFKSSQFNRATQAQRQPGSAMKPIIYAAAIEQGFTAADVIIDSPFILPNSDGRGKSWKPENFSKRFYGPTTLRQALEKSRNVVTVKLLNKIGIDTALSRALKMGIKSPLAPYLSLALGSSEVTLLELTSAYGALANLGVHIEPVFVERILDREEKIIDEHSFSRQQRALSAQTAYIVTNMLYGVIQRGTAGFAKRLPFPLAGKTGTTDNFKDAWFIGYSPELVAGVWLGMDKNQSLGKGETGGKAACPIWTSFMGKALESYKNIPEFPIPSGVYFDYIDPVTGLLAEEDSQNKFLEVFKEGNGPNRYSTSQKFNLDEDHYLHFIE